MGHSRDLLLLIAADVAKDWPAEAGYRMEFERPLPGVRGMLPDIIVFDAASKVRCVVEIGYTRPEKLTYYRQSGIRDVRWYDKEGKLHTGGQPHNGAAYVERFLPAPGVLFKQLVRTGVPCERCVEDHMASVCGAEHGEGDECVCNPIVQLEGDEWANEHADAQEEHSNTFASIVSNGMRWICLVYCDECDQSTVIQDDWWLAVHTDIEGAFDFETEFVAYLATGFREYSNILATQGRIVDEIHAPTLDLAAVITLAQKVYGVEINYSHFACWEHGDELTARYVDPPAEPEPEYPEDADVVVDGGVQP